MYFGVHFLVFSSQLSSTCTCGAIYLRAPARCDRRLSPRQLFEARLRLKRIGPGSQGLFFHRFHSAGGQYWSGLALFASQRPTPLLRQPLTLTSAPQPRDKPDTLLPAPRVFMLHIFSCLFLGRKLGGHFSGLSVVCLCSLPPPYCFQELLKPCLSWWYLPSSRLLMLEWAKIIFLQFRMRCWFFWTSLRFLKYFLGTSLSQTNKRRQYYVCPWNQVKRISSEGTH